MKAPWRIALVRSARRRLRTKLAGPFLIVMYHRVAEPAPDPRGLAWTPEDFEKQLRQLARRYEIVPLRELAARVDTGESRRRTAAVTLDDGYADNLEVAKPILEKLGIPATVFVATQNIGLKREFWWDELDRLFVLPDRLPTHLDVEIAGKRVFADLGESSRDTGVERRLFAYRQLNELCRSLLPREQQQLLDRLSEWSGLEREARTSHLVMDTRQIQELARGDLVDVGAHTDGHPFLARLTVVEQEAEMRKGREVLAEILGAPPRGFAYPYGFRSSYTSQTIEIARSLFDYSCTAHGGRMRRGHDVHLLSRFFPPVF